MIYGVGGGLGGSSFLPPPVESTMIRALWYSSMDVGFAALNCGLTSGSYGARVAEAQAERN